MLSLFVFTLQTLVCWIALGGIGIQMVIYATLAGLAAKLCLAFHTENWKFNTDHMDGGGKAFVLLHSLLWAGLSIYIFWTFGHWTGIGLLTIFTFINLFMSE